MNQNMLQNIVGFVLKYIWIFCALLIGLEIISVTYTANVLLQQSTLGVMQSVSGEVSGRVDGILRLLTGFSIDERFADTSKPLFDRAIQALPYQKSYNLYMIALTDEDVNVISADEDKPPAEPYSLSYREYMQELYATGKYQITDAFLSGDNTDTMNYTIAVPILKNGKVEGSVFGSIYFDDIENILNTYSQNNGHDFYLFGENNTIMAGDDGTLYEKSFLELSEGSYFIGGNINEIDQNMKERQSGNFWQWDDEGLFYVTYENVLHTNWTILYRVQFISVLLKLIPAMFLKICFYITMCGSVFFFGRRYLNRHLAQINHLLNRMAVIQKELFQSEQVDYDNLLDLTQQGLTDHLTGLCTRSVLFKKMMQFIHAPKAHGALVFIDLDDLKLINDNFGHEGGDCALLAFSKVLKKYEEKYNAIAGRYGGDEFVLLIDSIDEKTAFELVNNLCSDLNIKISVKEHNFSIHGSLGVSFYPEHGSSPEDLICKADLALYTAKQKGKNQCSIYNENSTLF